MTLRSSWAVLAGLAAAAACAPARAQTHAVKKPETVVRAVAVYEWTGDEAKPTASRLVPVSIFIDNQMEDAGVYLARPVPFALDRGTIFECEVAGKTEGTVELAYQRHLQGTDQVQLDDGWLGYGTFKPAPKEAVLVAAKKAGPLPQVVTSGGNRPHFSNGAGSGDAATATADDPSRPKMTRRTSSDSDSEAKTTASTPADSPAPAKDDDPNRPALVRRDGAEDATPTSASTNDSDKPTMRRRTDSTDSTASTTSDSSDEADRPTLKKRTPAQAKNNKRPGDTASVRSATNLNDDPDRPVLHRGTAAEAGVPPLSGLPADMHQLVAVSDAKNRPEHDFTRPWESFSEQAEVLRQMQTMARNKLAGYDMQPPAAAAPAPAPAAKATAKTGAKAKKAVTPAPPPPPVPVALTDETLKGYTLSYGGAATFVYTASSPGTAGATRYVTVVAQQEPLGELKQALASVTDSNHLDRTPWMRLVDVVDAEASNRASLLFEMREQHARQFALYRVIGARAEQVFQTGTTE
jgi:hypothetical protein